MDKHPTEVNNNPFNSYFLKDFVELAPEKKTFFYPCGYYSVFSSTESLTFLVQVLRCYGP